MRARPKALLTAAAVVALLVVLAALRAGGDDELRLETAQVTPGTIARRVMATGTIKPERAVEVGAQVSGTIASIHADFNASGFRSHDPRADVSRPVAVPPRSEDRGATACL